MAVCPFNIELQDVGFLATRIAVYLAFFPLNIDCAKLGNTGWNIVVFYWSLFRNLQVIFKCFRLLNIALSWKYLYP